MTLLLAVDVGNTQTVLGVYAEGDRVAPSHMWRIATRHDDAADDVRSKLLALLAAAQVDYTDIDEVALASVVPLLTRMWIRAVYDMTGINAQTCTARKAEDAGLFEADYSNPGESGADRVADAVAARALYGAPVVVVDFGTATNIEVIDAQGRFVGGIIAPGVNTGAEALYAHATLLSAVDLEMPESAAVIGTNSDEALRSGIVFGEAERADGLVRRIFSQLGQQCPVVATGGLATLIATHSSEITDVLPELTLEGLRLITQH